MESLVSTNAPAVIATTEVSVIAGPLNTINLVPFGISLPNLGVNSKASPSTSSVTSAVILAKWCCL